MSSEAGYRNYKQGDRLAILINLEDRDFLILNEPCCDSKEVTSKQISLIRARYDCNLNILFDRALSPGELVVVEYTGEIHDDSTNIQPHTLWKEVTNGD